MRLAKSLIVTAFVGCLVGSPPAYSADLSGLLQQFGSSVHSWSDLESRLNALDLQIDQARANGSLTVVQAADFKSQTQKIRAQELQAQSTGKRMSFVDMFNYTNNLNVIANQVDQTMQAKQSAVPDVDAYQAQVRKQINDARAAGQLTQQDADKLNQDLRTVADLESGFKSTGDGALNPRQSELLVKNLDRIKATISQQITASQSAIPELTQRRETVAKKILDATNTGTLTAAQAATFNADLGQIATTQQTYSSQGSISGSQIYSLATSIDRLEAKIDQAIATHGAVTQPVATTPPSELHDLTVRREALTRKIADATASGAITSQQSANLNAEVAQIYATQQSYGTAGSLTGSQAYNLLTSIERLESKVDQTIAAQGATPIASNLPPSGYPGGGRPSRDNTGGYADRNGPGRGYGNGPGSVDQSGPGYRNGPGGVDQSGPGYRNGPGGVDQLGPGDRNGPGRGYGNGPGSVDQSGPGYRNGPGGADQSGPGYRNGRGGADQSGPGYRNGPDGIDQSGDRNGPGRGYGNGPRQSYQDRGGTGYQNGQGGDYQNAPGSDQPPAVSMNQPPLYTSEQPATTGGSSYKDVQGYWGEPYISGLASRGIIGGFPDGTFKPNDQITRAQFAAIAAKALSIPSGGSASFRDVPARYWANGVIGAVSGAGLVTGFPDGSFRPEDKLTRAQALIILVKALHSSSPNPSEFNAYSDASEVPAWAQPSVSAAAGAHIIVNFPDPSLMRPNDLATRGEVAALTYQTLLKLGKDLPSISIGVLHPNRR